MRPGYDRWLAKPYQDRVAKEDAYLDWCERGRLDPRDARSRTLWDHHLKADT